MFVQPKPNVTRKMKIQTSVPTPITNPVTKFFKKVSYQISKVLAPDRKR